MSAIARVIEAVNRPSRRAERARRQPENASALIDEGISQNACSPTSARLRGAGAADCLRRLYGTMAYGARRTREWNPRRARAVRAKMCG